MMGRWIIRKIMHTHDATMYYSIILYYITAYGWLEQCEKSGINFFVFIFLSPFVASRRGGQNVIDIF